MDDPVQDLENELKALRPRRTSALLHARVARDLAAAPATASRYATATSLRSWKWLMWSAAGAAAALAVATGLVIWRDRIGPDQAVAPAVASTGPAPTAASAPESVAAGEGRYQPVSAASFLYDLRDEGLVTLANDQPARRARFRYVDTYTWRNPATNASLRVSVPRDEVRVLPAHYQ